MNIHTECILASICIGGPHSVHIGDLDSGLGRNRWSPLPCRVDNGQESKEEPRKETKKEPRRELKIEPEKEPRRELKMEPEKEPGAESDEDLSPTLRLLATPQSTPSSTPF